MSREPIAKQESSRLDAAVACYARVGSANRTAFQELKVVLAQFHEQGIECLLLKGADLIPRLYGTLGARPMADVDLLAHEADLPVIDRVLKKLEYRPQIDGNPAYGNPEHKLDVDVVTHIWYMDDPAIIWQRAVQREFQGSPVRAMDRNDLLLYLTAYAVVYRGRLAPLFAQDLALLLEKEQIEWPVVLSEASRCHLKIPLYHGLAYAVQRNQTKVPPEVMRQLAPSGVRERLLSWLLQKLVTETPIQGMGFFLLFITQPGARRLRWLTHSLFPPASFLSYRYGDRAGTHPILVRIGRPFSLAWQGLLLSGRILAALLKLR
ncbi:MAG: nucleotidyltransferase family protein [Nitrospiraceae bacterium]